MRSFQRLRNNRDILFCKALLLLALGLTACHQMIRPRFETDSKVLLQSAQWLKMWSRLSYPPPIPQPDSFPPFQHISAALLLPLFHDNSRPILWIWAYFSTFCFLALLPLSYRIAARAGGRGVGWLAMISILSGPVVTYGGTTFNEMPAALITLAFVGAVLSSRLFLAITLYFLAALTKEVAAPVLLLLWAACAWNKLLHDQKLRIVYPLGLLIPTVISYAIAARLNFLRFGVPFNLENLKDYRIVPFGAQQELYFLALCFSPSGGLCFFWPLAVAVTLPVLTLGATLLPKLHCFPPALFIVAAGLVLFLGLSRWHQPMGWNAWGCRLLIPWVPAFVVAILSLYPHAARSVGKALLRKPFHFFLIAFVVFVTCIPHFLTILSLVPSDKWFSPDSWIREIPPPESGNPYYYDTQNYQMWMKHPITLDVYRYAFHHPAEIPQALLYGSGIIAALWISRQKLLLPHSELTLEHSPAR